MRGVSGLRPYVSFGSLFFPMVAFYLVFIIGAIVFRYSDNSLPAFLSQAMQDQVVTFAVAIGLFLSLEVFFRSRARRLIARQVVSGEQKWVSLRRLGVLTLGVALLLMSIGLSAGINPLTDPLSFRQLIQGGGVAYFLFLFLFMLKVFGVVFFESLYSRNVSSTDFLILGGVMAFCLTSGFTSLFVYFFLAGGTYLSVRRRVKIIRWYTVAGFSLLLILTPLYTLVRELAKGGIEVDASTLITYGEKLQGNIFLVIYERFDYFINMVRGSQVARVHSDPAYVLNFLDQVIPRSIYPEKSLNFSSLMTSWSYPDNFANGVTGNFGFVAEFILYFGDFGAIVAGIFLGVLASFCQRKYFWACDSRMRALEYTSIVQPYFLAFPVAYINDGCFPTLLISLVAWRVIKPFVTVQYSLADVSPSSLH